MKADGFSITLIARKLKVSRRSIIGKCFRLGLCAKRRPRYRVQREKSPKARFLPDKFKRNKNNKEYVKHVKEAMHYAKKMVVEIVAPPADATAFFDLQKGQCRWPVGEIKGQTPSHVFCGGKGMKGSPYCAFHGNMAYQAPYRQEQARAGVSSVLAMS